MKVLFTILFAVVAFALAGRSDWSESVIKSMPSGCYLQIKERLGYECTEYDIAKEYLKNKEYYKQLNY